MYRVQENWFHTVYKTCAAYLYLGLAILLFLLLLSYNPVDLPDWVFFSPRSGQSGPAMSLGGAFGATIAGCIYFLLGAAAFLIPSVLLGFGLAKMAAPGFQVGTKFGWLMLCLVASTCLLHLQGNLLSHWKEEFQLLGPGGWLGYALGEKGLQRFFGTTWSWVMLLGLYSISVLFLAGIHPVRLVKTLWTSSGAAWKRWQAAREARLSEAERLSEDARKLEKEQQRLARQLEQGGKKPTRKRTKKTEPAQEAPARDDAPLPERKIIDTSRPLIDPGEASPKPAKPSLAEKMAKTGAEKSKKQGPDLNSGLELEDFTLPEIDLLDEISTEGLEDTDHEELEANHRTIVETLEHFGIKVRPGDITKGPTITRFEIYPDHGVRVDRIVALEKDLARATRAERINILAPIPGKDTVGIELANSNKVKVTLRELLSSDAWINSKAKIPLALGKDVYGRPVIGDLAAMPHCLVAGTTGSGKSVCINAVVASMLYRFTPEELRFIMIDPKVVEMQIYNVLPHLAVPVVTEPKKVIGALEWVVREMEQRYKWFAKTGVRSITGFNARPKPKPPEEDPAQPTLDFDGPPADAEVADAEPVDAVSDLAIEAEAAENLETDNVAAENVAANAMVEEEEPAPVASPPIRVPRDHETEIPEKLPYLVIIIDELADLMQTAPADVESLIARITQMARAAGIHMIVATQTPRADVVTGIIKANIPTRVAFQVASKLDSRVILDQNGADRLLGQGDMLYQPPGTSKLTRSQGVLVTDEEIQRLVDFIGAQADASYDPSILEKLEGAGDDDVEAVSDEMEEWITKALEVIRTTGKASTSHLQRRLGLGYNKAARIVDILEMRGILGPNNGVKGREVLVNLDSVDDLVVE